MVFTLRLLCTSRTSVHHGQCAQGKAQVEAEVAAVEGEEDERLMLVGVQRET